MPENSKFFTIKFLPDNLFVKVKKGTTILEAAGKAGLAINTECGGTGVCGKCKVKILKGHFKKHKHIELSVDEIDENIQLACLCKITGDMEVEIKSVPEPLIKAAVRKEKVHLQKKFVKDYLPYTFNFQPIVQRLDLNIDKPTLDNNASDFDRVISELKRKRKKVEITCPVPVLAKLPAEIRKKDGSITVYACEEQNSINIVDIIPQGKKNRNFGLAVDIGTTSAAVALIDLEEGKIVSERSEYNRQISYGPDIIHRIVFASKGDGLKKLRTKVLDTINDLTDSILKEVKTDKNSVYSCSISGNTTMQHLFLGINPKYIREEPYVPAVLHFPLFKAGDLNLNMNPEGIVYMTPGVSSYVGGDITAGVLKSGINRSSKLTLFIDLGTNGEIVLGNFDWMTGCACSAGPAFEGGGLKCGMRASTGAIEKIKIDAKSGDVKYNVIGGGKPKGICGSAVIDLLAGLYFANIINQKGRFNSDFKTAGLRKGKSGAEFVLVDKKMTETGEDLVITERDLDNIIRTKGAIWAGISTLLKAVHIKPFEIEEIIIAGAFGSYINVENVVLIGMLPDLPLDRFSFTGNASLHGAALALVSNEMRNEIEEISNKITNFELSATPGYMDEFIASLFIPHTDAELFPAFIKRKRG
ncbi:ASKHA domain-containing protein [candidate division KSB1 bacterium]